LLNQSKDKDGVANFVQRDQFPSSNGTTNFGEHYEKYNEIDEVEILEGSLGKISILQKAAKEYIFSTP